MTDPTAGIPPAPEGGVPASATTQLLSRDLSTFLVEFSIALHKNQMYPPGHPHLNTALVGFNDRIRALLATRPSISIGVARKQLVIEGVATDPDNPLLRELALKLHRHQLGAVKILPEVQDFEVAEFLSLLVQDPYLTSEPLGRPASGTLRRWDHLWIFPLSYDQLELIEASEDEGDARGPADRGRGGQLWVGLASAALASNAEGAHPAPASADPSEVAKAIDDHQGEKTYDQVIVGYMLQIADELKTDPNPEGGALNRRVSRLVNSLRPETLTRLLEMGGDTHQRSRFVLDATQGMAIDAVMELVKAAAAAGSQNMSSSLVRLLNKLAVHAEVGVPETREGADRELREHVRKLVTGWDLDDPNPNSYTDILEGMSRERPDRATPGGDHTAEPERLLQMAVEVDGLGETIMTAVDTLVKEGRMGIALDILEKPPRRNEAAMTLLDYLVSPERLVALLADESAIDFELVDRVARRLGSIAAEPLLDAYAAAEQRAVRRKLHDRVTTIGAGIGDQVVARLTGTPWYVQRNMLTLLASMSTWPDGFTPDPWARHEDPRVRREAYRLLFRLPDKRSSALTAALADPDEGIERLALAVATEGCPPSMGDRLDRVAADKARSPEMRALALRAVGGLRRSETLPLLLEVSQVKGGFLRRARLHEKGPELLAALSVLAQFWAEDEEAAVALALAAKSDDPQIRAAARRRGAKK